MELDFIDISRTGGGKPPKNRSAERRPVKNSQRTGGNKKKEALRLRQAAVQKKRRRRKRRAMKTVILLCEAGFVVLLCFLIYSLIRSVTDLGDVRNVFHSQRREMIRGNDSVKPEITEAFLTVNPYSRPGEELPKVKNIFVHYTANQGTDAAQNRSYFENLGITGEVSASAHFIIGYEGEIIQCVPLNEIAYAVAGRNYDSISIECCYLAQDGQFTESTYQSLIQLSAWLLKEYKLIPQDMLRHYDEGGKRCPLYYTENEDAWEQFKADLKTYIMKSGETAA